MYKWCVCVCCVYGVNELLGRNMETILQPLGLLIDFPICGSGYICDGATRTELARKIQ